MAVSDIVQKIIDDAVLEAEEIKRDGQKKVDQILEEAKEEASYKKRECLENSKEALQIETRKIITNANMEAKRLVQVAKSDVIDEVFELAAKKIDKTRIPKKMVILKDGRKEEGVEPKDFLEQVKPRLAARVARILNIE